jgi:hypothetical protein
MGGSGSHFNIKSVGQPDLDELLANNNDIKIIIHDNKLFVYGFSRHIQAKLEEG